MLHPHDWGAYHVFLMHSRPRHFRRNWYFHFAVAGASLEMIQGALEGVALKWGALESGFVLDCGNTSTPATFGLSCTVICFLVVLLESSRVVGNIDRRSHLRECVDVMELTP